MQKKRWQSKQYLKYVASHPCLLCQHNETQAHHITITEKRGISQKVSDYYTLPLCYLHHDQLHNTGERKFWKILDLNPVDLAKYFFDLWEKGNKDKEIYIQQEVYDKVLPKIRSNIDFLMQVKL